jgi:hypothetical protein
VTFLADSFSSSSLKINGGGIKKHQVKTGEKITVRMKHFLFDEVLDAPGRKGTLCNSRTKPLRDRYLIEKPYHLWQGFLSNVITN